ncbi:MAG: Holliday junction resolvase RuvX [Patescibacteria group bacterium]|jgi:putative Holliday junction resolvase
MIKKSPAKSTKSEIFLGVDYGSRNIGLAFGRGGLAQPLKIISGKNQASAIEDIVRVVIENGVDKVVVGLPLTADDKETAQSLETRRFAKILKIKLKRPVEFVNEYETSLDASKAMFGMGFSRNRREQHDHFSAALILKSYFELNL